MKGPISDCSVSPGEPPHAGRLRRDEKHSQTAITGKTQMKRALFKGNERPKVIAHDNIKGRSAPKKNSPTIAAGPFNMSITTAKQDLNMLEFIFKETPQYDIFARYVHNYTVSKLTKEPSRSISN